MTVVLKLHCIMTPFWQLKLLCDLGKREGEEQPTTEPALALPPQPRAGWGSEGHGFNPQVLSSTLDGRSKAERSWAPVNLITFLAIPLKQGSDPQFEEPLLHDKSMLI